MSRTSPRQRDTKTGRRLAAGLAALVVAGSASTVTHASEAGVTGGGEDASEAVVIDELFTLRGVHVRTVAFGRDGREVPVPASFRSLGSARASQAFIEEYERGGGELTNMGSGTYSTSTSSGCRRTTVRNERESTYFHATLFWYNNWTHYCWNRSAKDLDLAGSGHYLEDVHWSVQAGGPVVDDRYFYPWAYGYPQSRHWHERQFEMKNCPIKFGCVGSWYPRNRLRVHSDGTYNWATWD